MPCPRSREGEGPASVPDIRIHLLTADPWALLRWLWEHRSLQALPGRDVATALCPQPWGVGVLGLCGPSAHQDRCKTQHPAGSLENLRPDRLSERRTLGEGEGLPDGRSCVGVAVLRVLGADASLDLGTPACLWDTCPLGHTHSLTAPRREVPALSYQRSARTDCF